MGTECVCVLVHAYCFGIYSWTYHNIDVVYMGVFLDLPYLLGLGLVFLDLPYSLACSVYNVNIPSLAIGYLSSVHV